MKYPRLLIGDDHLLVAQGIAKILEQSYAVHGIVTNGKTLLRTVQRIQPDLVLLDISLPVMNGFEVAQRIRRFFPKTKIVFVTMHDEAPFMNEALLMGVSGYFLKQSSATELMKGLKEVMKGHTYYSPMIHPAMPIWGRSAVKRKRRLKEHIPLTPRQRAILQLAAEGFANKKIAQTLSLSLKTVEFHKSNMKKRLGVATTAEITKYALRQKLIGL